MDNLMDTVSLMGSEGHRDRFKAEYLQTKIRADKLRKFITKIDAAQAMRFTGEANVEEPKHDCPISLLKQQLNAMDNYLHILEMRALIENVGL